MPSCPRRADPIGLPGDYVYSNQRLPYSQSGQWGYLRVLPSGDQRLLPLAGAGAGTKSASLEERGARDSCRGKVVSNRSRKGGRRSERGRPKGFPLFLCGDHLVR